MEIFYHILHFDSNRVSINLCLKIFIISITYNNFVMQCNPIWRRSGCFISFKVILIYLLIKIFGKNSLVKYNLSQLSYTEDPKMISYITIINIVIFRIVKYLFYAFHIILSSQSCDKTVNKVQNIIPFSV